MKKYYLQKMALIPAINAILFAQILFFSQRNAFTSAFLHMTPIQPCKHFPSAIVAERNTVNQFFIKNKRIGSVKLQASLGPSSPFDPASFQLPSEKVMSAVEKAGGRVTFTDVAATAGIDLSEAQQGLVTLAAMTQATLEVSKDGDIVYVFPKDFRGILRNQSTLQRIRDTYNTIQPVLYYLLRVAFGSLLFVSLFVVFSSIILIQTSSSSDDDDRRSYRRSPGDFGGGGFGMNYWLGPSPFDFFYYRPYYGYYYDDYYGRSNKPEDMGFLQAIFSYVFGDGDPNTGFEEKRMETIAQIIRLNGCAVTAEQLAPYLDPPSPKKNQGVNVQESFMLPVLTRFRGVPEVTPEGEIIYVFPELKTSAFDSLDPALRGLESKPVTEIKKTMLEKGVPYQDIFEKKDLITRLRQWSKGKSTSSIQADLPIFLQEKPNKFSVAGNFKLIFAGILGAVNLLGILYLGTLFSQIGAAQLAQLPGIIGFSKDIYPVLFAYAVGFNAFPAWRYFSLQKKNEGIESRNRSRQAYAEALVSGNSYLQQKLESARKYRMKVKTLNKEDITYSTAQDINEQPEASNRIEDDFSDFDKRLGQK